MSARYNHRITWQERREIASDQEYHHEVWVDWRNDIARVMTSGGGQENTDAAIADSTSRVKLRMRWTRGYQSRWQDLRHMRIVSLPTGAVWPVVAVHNVDSRNREILVEAGDFDDHVTTSSAA